MTKTNHTQISLFGISHHTAPISIREHFSLSQEKRSQLLNLVLADPNINEALTLSTCNRCEIILVGTPRMDHASLIVKALSIISGITSDQFLNHLYHYQREQAVRHLFRVASGLESLILGEAQIFGQIKRAYLHASEIGASKGVLAKLLSQTFHTAKAVRTRTRISHKAVSICYAARELAQKRLGDLSKARVMIIGTGETGTLALRHFISAGVTDVLLFNKTFSRAQNLATQAIGQAIPLSSRHEHLPSADIIIGACALPQQDQPLFSNDEAYEALKKRNGGSQLYIDLGVPRNFCSNIECLPNTMLYNIDDLQQVVSSNLSARKEEASQAEAIIETKIQAFKLWQQQQRLTPIITKAKRKLESYHEQEIEKTLKRIEGVSTNPAQKALLRQALEDMSCALIKKTMHQPWTTLKEQADNEEIVQLFDACFG